MRVLPINADPSATQAIRYALGDRYDIRVATSVPLALAIVRARSWRAEIAIAGIDLPDAAGASAVERPQMAVPDASAIVGTGARKAACAAHEAKASPAP